VVDTFLRELGVGLIFEDESYAILGACFDVYNELGCGFLEPIYQECLALELTDRLIPFRAQATLELLYKGRPLEQRYKVDFICFEKIVVELKAVKQLADEHRAQVHNYLKATSCKLGLLINFGRHPKLEYERIVR
jgi:GxxExxY protein